MSTPPARILIADEPGGIEAIRQALAGTAFALVPASTVLDTLRMLRDAQSHALVMCGCHVDDGGMYDLLRQMKVMPASAQVPFVAIRSLEGELDDTLYDSVAVAVQALGGDAFVDLLRWQREDGHAEAGRRLTALVTRLVQAGAGGG